MAERGWVEGRTIVFERRVAQRRQDLPAVARELVESKVDLIVAMTTQSALAAKAATATMPIFFAVGGDPVRAGLVASMARPGGNLTGFTFGLFDEKLLEILQQAVPKASRVMYPEARPTDASVRAAQALGVRIFPFPVPGPEAFDAFFQEVRKVRPDGVVVPNIGWMAPHTARIATELKALRVPAIAIWTDFAKAGGLLAYGAVPDNKRAADKIDALLRGANPGEMAVEMPTHFHLIVNVATASYLGIEIPESLLARADQVIHD